MIKFLVLAFLLMPAMAEMPDPYYYYVQQENTTPEAICSALEEINYSALYSDTFDCTQISAHAERKLENMGIDTNLIINFEMSHCYIQALTSEGWLMFEACTDTGEVFALRDISSEYYSENVTVYRNIYELLSDGNGFQDVNWWDTLES
jgi:hypothetical protein